MIDGMQYHTPEHRFEKMYVFLFYNYTWANKWQELARDV